MSTESSSRAPEGAPVTEASAPEINNDVALLQGLTDVSEAELRGDDPTENTAPSEPTGDDKDSGNDGEEQVPNEDPKDAEVKDEAKSEELVESKEESKEEKVPKGFVPLAALHEVRGENKYLKDQLAKLTDLVSAKVQAPVEQPVVQVPTEFAEFKELSESDFNSLVETNPVDAVKYINKLTAYKTYKQDQAAQEREYQASQEYLSQVYASASRTMEETVPGIFDESSTAASEFRDFAVSVGFDETMFYLTNPATQIILPGDTTPAILGEHAAQIIKVLAQARQLANKPAPAEANIEKIKADLRKEIEAEVMSKVKAGSTFRSLNSVPDTGDARPEFADKVLSESAFLKLTPKEQEMYLAGQ